MPLTGVAERCHIGEPTQANQSSLWAKLHCLGVADMPNMTAWPGKYTHMQVSLESWSKPLKDLTEWVCRIKTHNMESNTALKWQNLLTLSHSLQNMLDMGSPFDLTSSTSTLGKKMSKIVTVQNLLPHSLGRIKQKKPHNNNYGEWIPRKNFHGYRTQLQTIWFRLADISSCKEDIKLRTSSRICILFDWIHIIIKIIFFYISIIIKIIYMKITWQHP